MNVRIAAKHEKSHLHAQNVKKRLHTKQNPKRYENKCNGTKQPSKEKNGKFKKNCTVNCMRVFHLTFLV